MCDFTRKDGRFISLKNNLENVFENVQKENYQEIQDFCV
jgi:hypothetical protein